MSSKVSTTGGEVIAWPEGRYGSLAPGQSVDVGLAGIVGSLCQRERPVHTKWRPVRAR